MDSSVLLPPLESAGQTGKWDVGKRTRRGARCLGQADRFWMDTGRGGAAGGGEGKSGSGARLDLAEGKRDEAGGEGGGGMDLYLERVFSAKCFCWLSACLRERNGA